MREETAASADAAAALQARLRADLVQAMRARETLRTRLLRALIAALDDAQAVPPGDRHDRYVEHAFGDRSAEVPQVLLDAAAVRAVIAAEVRARREAAEEMQRVGQPERAATLREEAQVAEGYVA